MSIVKRFITESIKRTEIDEFLQKKLDRAGYGGVNISKTPLGTHVVIYAMRPGLVIGRGGETIKELASALEQNFKVSESSNFRFRNGSSQNSTLTSWHPELLQRFNEVSTLGVQVFGR